MTDRRSSDVLGGLPNSRPHRRSEKRGAPAVEPSPPEQPEKAEAPAEKAAPVKKTASARKPASAKKASTAKRSTSAKKPAPAKKPARAKQATKASSTARKGPSRPRSTRPPLQQPAQPGGTPKARRASQPEPDEHQDILGTAIQAAAELAEIGLTVGARALRSAMSRIPRP